MARSAEWSIPEAPAELSERQDCELALLRLAGFFYTRDLLIYSRF
jgi:hypothetical protein